MPDDPFLSEKHPSQLMLERHIQTFIQLVLVGLLAWGGKSLNELQQIAARQEERLITLNSSLTDQGGRLQKLESDQVNILIRLDRLEQTK